MRSEAALCPNVSAVSGVLSIPCSSQQLRSVVVLLAQQGLSVLQRDPSVWVSSVFTDVTVPDFRALTAAGGRYLLQQVAVAWRKDAW